MFRINGEYTCTLGHLADIYLYRRLQMPLTNCHGLYINPVCEPPFILKNFNVIDARHALAHFAFFFAVDLKSPVFEAVCSEPLSILVMILVEELYSLNCKDSGQQ